MKALQSASIIDGLGVVFCTCFVFALVFFAQIQPKTAWSYSFPSRTFADVCVLMNIMTLLLLIVGRIAILRGVKTVHALAMKSAMVASIVFLASYLLQHALVGETKYPADAPFRAFYFFVLITHILISAILLPHVLVTAVKAVREDFELHKKYAKRTFWLWLYVSVTGILIYIMISPFYG